jgi:cephalosporin-C deacetylase
MDARIGTNRPESKRICFLIYACVACSPCIAQQIVLEPYKSSGIYEPGETAGWSVHPADGTTAPRGAYHYTIKKNNQDVIKTGNLDLDSDKKSVEAKLNEPAMLYLELAPPAGNGREVRPIVAGAAIAPTMLKPSAARPADFDAFWESQIKMLEAIPENPVLTPADSGKPTIEYATIRMDHIQGTHVYGQIAKPKRDGKFPAVVIFQWASPPYPLQKEWVTDRAAEGWLALNIEPHDVLPDQPQAYYNALPDAIKHYESIGNNDRDKSYFLAMYLRDYRAVDYVASRPDWDGRTLVVMGISMGGQQSLCVAGLHPKITHVIVDVPAGCDTNGPLHGRQSSYPFFPANDPKVMQTALYFDAVNFAPRIKATSLVAMGFVDTISAPTGVWTAFDQIQGPKEAVPMIDSPHNHLATPAQQRPYTERSAEWLNTLVKGGEVRPRPISKSTDESEPQVDDHQLMMNELGIKKLRPGADPHNDADFDEATANRFQDTMPDVLAMKNGTKVTRADQWPKRRAELVEDFEHEIYGRIPDGVPNVTWKVISTTEGLSGDIPINTKSLVGHVDNSTYPQVEVYLQASVTVPARAKTPVPVMVAFSGGFGGRSANHFRAGRSAGIPWTQQAIANGWGYAFLDPASIQPDNAAGLRRGIIDLTNKGEPRKTDQWGALRAWQWGASQLIDYFAATKDSHVDPTKIGIEGLSRFGKAALVTEAFDERVAVGLIGSSGAGGAKLYRHIYGETVENLAGGEYYWMAGNFMKYAAAESKFGSMTAADLPVDSHELIALCAPRPCFISYGTVEGGDPKWVDARGSFMACVLAGPVYRLLGKHDFGTTGGYLTVPLPPVGQLIGGELAWRQHNGGHDVTPNWPTFFGWVGDYIQTKRPSKTISHR